MSQKKVLDTGVDLMNNVTVGCPDLRGIRLDGLGFSQFCKAIRMLPCDTLKGGTITVALSGKEISMKVVNVESVQRRAFRSHITIGN